MKKNDQITSGILFLFGLYVAFEGYSLQLGSLNNPKAGFLIFWTGIILSILSSILFFKSHSTEDSTVVHLWKGLQWQKGVKVIVYLTVYVTVFQWLGFIISTFILLLFLFKSLEPQKWSTAISFSIGVTIFCHVVFGYFFEVRFPLGITKDLFQFFSI